MKKIFMFFSVMLFAMVAKAQTDHIEVAPLNLNIGESGKVCVSLFNTERDYTLFVLDVELPEGLSFCQYKSGRENVWGEVAADRSRNHSLTSAQPGEDPQVRRYLVEQSENLNLWNEDEEGNPVNEVLYCGIKADENTAAGEYTIKVKNVEFTALENGKATTYTFEDVEAVVKVVDPVVNENAWTAIQEQVANVQAAIDNFDAIVATMMYASRMEGEEFTGVVDAAREWVKTTTETYQAKYEAGELTAEDGVKGESAEQVLAVNEALNMAAYYDVYRYVEAVYYYWYGNEEEGVESKRDYVESVIEQMAGPGKSALEEQVDLVDIAINSSLMEKMYAYAQYSAETHQAIIVEAEGIKASITDIVAAAKEAEQDIATGINGISNANADNAEYFDLNGVKASRNINGIVIKRIGGKTIKFVKK